MLPLSFSSLSSPETSEKLRNKNNMLRTRTVPNYPCVLVNINL